MEDIIIPISKILIEIIITGVFAPNKAIIPLIISETGSTNNPLEKDFP